LKDAILAGFHHEGSDTAKIRHALPLERGGVLYARIALGALDQHSICCLLL
jgi:hypothetical protein